LIARARAATRRLSSGRWAKRKEASKRGRAATKAGRPRSSR
jgi:hypothetical protein